MPCLWLSLSEIFFKRLKLVFQLKTVLILANLNQLEGVSKVVKEASCALVLVEAPVLVWTALAEVAQYISSNHRPILQPRDANCAWL